MPFDLSTAKPVSSGFDLSTAKPAGRVNKDYEEGKAKPAWQQGLVAGTNGLLLGFADEIGGAIGGAYDTLTQKGQSLSGLVAGTKPKTLAENYTANRDNLRGMEAAQRERSPITTAVAQGLSSLPLTVAAPAVAGGLRMSAATPVVAGVGARALQSAAVGTGFGALSGAGNSTATTVEGVASDTLKGGLISGALGGVASPVAAGIGAAGRNIGQRVSDRMAEDFARQKIAQALARDARGTLATGGYVNPLGQAAARFNKLGDEAVVADAGGRNTNQLLDTLATLPGRTKDAAYNLLHARTAGVGDRMRDSAERALGTNGQRLGDTVESLITQRQQAASPLYAQLRATDISPNQSLGEIVRAADHLGVTKLAKEIAAAKQQPFTLDVGAQGPQRWNMGDLDHVKQGIDQVLASSKAIGKDGKLTPLGNAYQSLKDRLTSELDAATTNPQTGASLYGKARAAFANPSKLIDAANAGKLAVSRDEASILGTIKGMSANELDAFRIGAFEGLRGKLGTQGGQTDIMNMWKNQATQEKLRAIFGTERAYREFAASVARESSLKRLQSVGTGSQTAARQAGMGDLDTGALTDAGSAVGAAKTGNILAAIGSAKNVWNRLAVPQTVRDQMGQMLMSRGTDASQTLNALAPMVQRINGQNMLLSNRVGVLGSVTTNQLAAPYPPRD